MLTAKPRFVPAKIQHGYNWSKQRQTEVTVCRHLVFAIWLSTPQSEQPRLLNSVDGARRTAFSWCGSTVSDLLIAFFFSLFCSNAAHTNSLYKNEEEEAQKLLAKQHRCPIFFSFHARHNIFQMRCLFLQVKCIDSSALGKFF